MRRAAILLFATMAVFCCADTWSAARQLPVTDPPLPLPGGNQQARKDSQNAVQFLSPVQVPVTAGRPAVVDLHFKVSDGLHINSHTPHGKTLVPTRLAVVEEPGIDVTAVDFPPGSSYTLAFAPQEKLSVYTGEFVLRAHLTAKKGEHTVQAALRYQACDVNACMPPRTLPIEIGILAK